MKRVLREVAYADHTYTMIHNGDRILAGISGGKDSAFLLYALKLYKEKCEASREKSFTVIPVHLSVRGITPAIRRLDAFFHDLGIDILTVETEIGDILEMKKDNDRISCSLCSALRRGRMTALAQEYGCTAVAYAHHGSDAAETMLLNMVFSGGLRTFPPCTQIADTGIRLIRPLCTVSGTAIANLAASLHIPYGQSMCANSSLGMRAVIREKMKDLCSLSDNGEANMIRAVKNSLYGKGDRS